MIILKSKQKLWKVKKHFKEHLLAALTDIGNALGYLGKINVGQQLWRVFLRNGLWEKI